MEGVLSPAPHTILSSHRRPLLLPCHLPLQGRGPGQVRCTCRCAPASRPWSAPHCRGPDCTVPVMSQAGSKDTDAFLLHSQSPHKRETDRNTWPTGLSRASTQPHTDCTMCQHPKACHRGWVSPGESVPAQETGGPSVRHLQRAHRSHGRDHRAGRP